MNRLNGMPLRTVMNRKCNTTSTALDGVLRTRHCANVLLYYISIIIDTVLRTLNERPLKNEYRH